MSEQLDVEQRLRRLEDIEAIKRLQAKYCHYADRGYEGAGHGDDALAALFVEDGIWENNNGAHQGREAISKFASGFYPFGFHLSINPDVEVDGDVAYGRWWGFIPLTDPDDGPLYSILVYNNTFVRTPEGWRFKHLRATAAVRSTYAVGWAKEGLVSELGVVESG